jgi:polyisoprenoid-binding protein YceI
MKLAALATAIITICLQATPSLAADQAVKLTIRLSPAGNFVSGTSVVNGSAHRLPDGSYKAEHVVIPLTTLTSGIEVRDEHMKNKYLEVQKFPNAEIVSAVGRDGKGSGQLKVKDMIKPVAGTYKIEGSNMHLTFPVKLSDYKFEKIRYMGVGVKDEVTVDALIPIK